MVYKLTKHLDLTCNGVRRKTNISTGNANVDLLDDCLFPIYYSSNGIYSGKRGPFEGFIK